MFEHTIKLVSKHIEMKHLQGFGFFWLCLAFNIQGYTQPLEKPVVGDVETDIAVRNLYELNSGKLDFSPMFYRNGLVFVSTRNSSTAGNTDPAINELFMDLYYAPLDKNGFSSVQNFSSFINTTYHEGPATFDKAGNTMFFTRNTFRKGRIGFIGKRSSKLKIYSADKSIDWGNVQELSFNDDRYNYCHPALSADGRYLYLSSDCPGGYGGHDLYVSEYRDGNWQKPVNLGPEINTDGNELFPFIHNDGTLYFASNGHLGYGGLDIYYSFKNKTGENQWSEPENIRSPFNSRQDDFGFILNIDKTRGYFSSNRAGGMGGDDIYAFSGNVLFGPPPVEKRELAIKVIEKKTGKSIPGVNIALERCTDGINPNSGSKITGSGGNVRYRVICDELYCLVAEKSGMFTTQKTFNLANCESTEIELEMDYRLAFFFGKLKDSRGGYMSDAHITLVNDCTGEHTETLTNEKGYFILKGDCSCSYTITIKKDGMQTLTEKIGEDCNGNVAINLKMEELDFSYQIGQVKTLENLHFKYAEWKVSPEAEKALEPLIIAMTENSNMKIEIACHTDARGDDMYNLQLSQKRAESVRQYLIGKGIEAVRLTAKGYGETQLLNTCSNGVRCSEEEHQRNRRAEFKVLYLGQ